MNARLQMMLIRSGNLLPLSLVNATKTVPQPVSNEERARTFRAAMPSPAYNCHPWHTFPPSPSAASTPLSLVAGGLEPIPGVCND